MTPLIRGAMVICARGHRRTTDSDAAHPTLSKYRSRKQPPFGRKNFHRSSRASHSRRAREQKRNFFFFLQR